MGLTVEQMKAREGKLTASMIGTLMRGDEQQLYDLWREVSGDPTWVGPDFSDNFAVQLGITSEELNLKWFSKSHGAVTRKGEVITHENGWASCTLDGWSVDNECPVEAKHCIQFKKIADILDWYAPQLHWQMFVCGTKKVYASVIIGAIAPEITLIEWDSAYGEALVKRGRDFMDSVWSLKPPVRIPGVAAPVRKEDYKTVPMEGNNEWASAATDWLENKENAEKFEAAKETIKGLMASDTGCAFGYNVIAKRTGRGITIKEGTV